MIARAFVSFFAGIMLINMPNVIKMLIKMDPNTPTGSVSGSFNDVLTTNFEQMSQVLTVGCYVVAPLFFVRAIMDLKNFIDGDFDRAYNKDRGPVDEKDRLTYKEYMNKSSSINLDKTDPQDPIDKSGFVYRIDNLNFAHKSHTAKGVKMYEMVQEITKLDLAPHKKDYEMTVHLEHVLDTLKTYFNINPVVRENLAIDGDKTSYDLTITSLELMTKKIVDRIHTLNIELSKPLLVQTKFIKEEYSEPERIL